MSDLFKAYMADKEKDGKLIANFKDNWKALSPRFGNLGPSDITNDLCRAYARERDERGRSASTIWTELTRLRSCINWAWKQNMLERKPYVWVPTKPPARDTVMTEEEVLRLLDGCIMPHVKLFIILGLTTGARSGAIVDLTWDRVDFEASSIDFRLKEVYDPLTKKARKGRSIVPMTAEARAALLDAKQGALTDHVIEWDGMPVKKIRKGFAAAVGRAGLASNITPHVLRHTVCTWLDEAGIPMERISKLVGHRDVNTTRQIYAKPSVETLRPAAEVIDMKIRRRVPA